MDEPENLNSTFTDNYSSDGVGTVDDTESKLKKLAQIELVWKTNKTLHPGQSDKLFRRLKVAIEGE